MNDTICVISTAQGVGAISIVRVTGEDSLKIVNKIFKGKDLSKVASHTINYGYILDEGTVVDEVLVSVMLAPKTFTTEDVVEINCHGGIASTNKILELLLTNGCRLAEPGEFTKRAFLNGRIDLIEAEAVSDLIEAETDSARNLAINQVTGQLSKIIKELRQEILSLLANIEVNIDFPEYEDAEVITLEVLTPKLALIKEKLENIIKESKNSKVIKSGINVAIVGKPNVGKSSILNHLLEENKAIVTNIAGTTRDIVEGSIILSGIKLNFIDTAGIRETEDVVEKIGVDKSLETLKNADLVILVLNNNEILTIDEIDLITNLQHKKSLIFINKSDLPSKLDSNLISKYSIITGNTTELNGLDTLKEKIIEIFALEQITTKNLTYLSNARQISLINRAYQKVIEVEKAIDNQTPIDFLTIDIKECWDLLGEIIGVTYKEELIDELFTKFCLGK